MLKKVRIPLLIKKREKEGGGGGGGGSTSSIKERGGMVIELHSGGGCEEEGGKTPLFYPLSVARGRGGGKVGIELSSKCGGRRRGE